MEFIVNFVSILFSEFSLSNIASSANTDHKARRGTDYTCLMPTYVFKTESTRKSSNIYLSWTKIEYQNNLNAIALFSTLNKR